MNIASLFSSIECHEHNKISRVSLHYGDRWGYHFVSDYGSVFSRIFRIIYDRKKGVIINIDKYENTILEYRENNKFL